MNRAKLKQNWFTSEEGRNHLLENELFVSVGLGLQSSSQQGFLLLKDTSAWGIKVILELKKQGVTFL